MIKNDFFDFFYFVCLALLEDFPLLAGQARPVGDEGVPAGLQDQPRGGVRSEALPERVSHPRAGWNGAWRRHGDHSRF